MRAFYSHYDENSAQNSRFLVKHLMETAGTARQYVLAVPESVALRTELAELAKWIGLTHDFGKYTTFFQDYLIHDADHGVKKNHSLIGALWSMFVLLNTWQHQTPDKTTAMVLAFACIRKHHGDLSGMEEELKTFFQFQRDDLRDSIDVSDRRQLFALFENQMPDIRKNAASIQKEWSEHRIDFPSIEAFASALVEFESDYWNHIRRASLILQMAARKKELSCFHDWLYLLFSALIDADKRDAGQVDKKRSRFGIQANIVDAYKSQIDFGQVNPQLKALRNQLYDQLEEQAVRLSLDRHIYTLTAPTGSGKTLAALNFALKLRKRIEEETGYLPRIIYALPFTSIIDQNYDVFHRVLSMLDDHQKSPADRLIKHHHLAELAAYSSADNETYPLDKLMMLVESWESEIIVTTFVQFFETLIGRRNRMLKKFHNLYGSIILLDEIQNVPVEYWGLIRKRLAAFAEHAGCFIVLMTATQPLIFPNDQVVELVGRPDALFSTLERIQLSYHPEKLSLERFADMVEKDLNHAKSCAVICNTIRSSLESIKLLSKNWNNSLYYLSTNIIPKHRHDRIVEIQKRLKKREPVLLISTQVIEAGVDFDFDVIYRDIGPIDSIIQAAGRANRNAIGTKGSVHVVNLIDDNERDFARWIYGKAHLWVAEKLLSEKVELSEPDFYKLVQENYAKLVAIQDQAIGKQIYDAWYCSGDFDMLNKFNLIDYKANYIDVFLEIDDEAGQVWTNYQKNVAHENDWSKRTCAYLDIRADFKKYIISIPAKLKKKMFWDYCNGNFKKIGYISRDFADEFYDKDIGFIRDIDDRTMIF